MTSVPKPEADTVRDASPAKPLPLEPGDFYYEGDTMVFTAQYHLRRGSCCGSGCRHCPY